VARGGAAFLRANRELVGRLIFHPQQIDEARPVTCRKPGKINPRFTNGTLTRVGGGGWLQDGGAFLHGCTDCNNDDDDDDSWYRQTRLTKLPFFTPADRFFLSLSLFSRWDSPRNAVRRGEWNTFAKTMASFSPTTKASRLQLLADRRAR